VRIARPLQARGPRHMPALPTLNDGPVLRYCIYYYPSAITVYEKQKLSSKSVILNGGGIAPLGAFWSLRGAIISKGARGGELFQTRRLKIIQLFNIIQQHYE
jgi:hypothetical protein